MQTINKFIITIRLNESYLLTFFWYVSVKNSPLIVKLLGCFIRCLCLILNWIRGIKESERSEIEYLIRQTKSEIINDFFTTIQKNSITILLQTFCEEVHSSLGCISIWTLNSVVVINVIINGSKIVLC